jgi:hypothetical protein
MQPSSGDLLNTEQQPIRPQSEFVVCFSTTILVLLYVFQVVYFTSMFPYIVLTIFFIKGLTLKGASAGLIHMYTPKVSRIPIGI